MAAMMLMQNFFNNGCVFTAWLFLSGFHFFSYFQKPNPVPFYWDMISRLLYHKFC